jgi:3-hydroxybutyryl-CoA dehydratase
VTAIHGYYIDDLTIGMSASISKTITADQVNLFAKLTGDNNPIHINEAYAATTPFKSRIVHGMLSTSLISAVIGAQLPGPGSIYRDQTIKFKAPVFLGETLTATVTVEAINLRRHLVRLKTECAVAGKLVATGYANALVNGRDNQAIRLKVSPSSA